jgi:CRP/FNR family nitrogen fixation transcriptional regulator
MENFNVLTPLRTPRRRQTGYNIYAEAKAEFSNAFMLDDTHKAAKQALLAIRRGPIRYCRNSTIVCEGDPSDYVFLIVDGTVRSCRTFENGTRSIVAFHIPGELFGWTDDVKHSLSAEAATDSMILFFKRSILFSLATHESKLASFLLAATTNELRRVQEHSLLLGRNAKCRVASFLLDLSKRMGDTKNLDLPMSHQDIADHLGLTIETVSRTITEMEQTGLIARASPRTLILLNRAALIRIMK